MALLSNSNLIHHNPNNVKRICRFCSKEVGIPNIGKHEASCYLNPRHRKLCPVCGVIVKNYMSADTCSISCSNVFYTEKRAKSKLKEGNYSRICFEFHKHRCVICGEGRILDVHHYDENHSNSNPENLIPLCPTHHRYIHSKYSNEFKSILDEFRISFIAESLTSK